MAGLNKVMLIGRIGKDPDTYSFDDGTKKISFSMATTESYRDKNRNEWVDQTEWHNVVGYRYLAEKNFAKGDLVYLEGKIRTRKYNDKDANERFITEIIADKINILTRSQAGGDYSNAPQQQSPDDGQDKSAGMENTDAASAQMEDDLPF